MQDEILKEFEAESKTIVQDALLILNGILENLDQYRDLSIYSNAIDRIMGGAATVAIEYKPDHPLHLVKEYTLVCKVLSLQLAESDSNRELLKSCVALLVEATKIVEKLLRNLHLSGTEIFSVIPQNFIGNFNKISDQFKQTK